jgi:hypothetical protein
MRTNPSSKEIVNKNAQDVSYENMGGFDDENRASSSSVDLWMPSEMATNVHFIESALKKSGE